MRNFIRWLRAVGIWLSEAWHVGLALVVIIGVIAGIRIFGTTESAIRWGGMLLQLFGVATVAWGISQTRAFFRHPPFLIAARAWLGRCPTYKPVKNSASMNVVLPPLTGRIYTSAIPPPPDQAVESRLSALEEEQVVFRKRLIRLHILIEDETRKFGEAVSTEARKRVDAIDDVLKRLELTATGGIHITAVGIAWLFIGVVFSSASPELSSWVNAK